jgi:hypothetical protein
MKVAANEWSINVCMNVVCLTAEMFDQKENKNIKDKKNIKNVIYIF